MEDLPIEIMLIIFSYADNRTIYNIGATTIGFKNILIHNCNIILNQKEVAKLFTYRVNNLKEIQYNKNVVDQVFRLSQVYIGHMKTVSKKNKGRKHYMPDLDKRRLEAYCREDENGDFDLHIRNRFKLEGYVL